jgi:hypothetical protein
MTNAIKALLQMTSVSLQPVPSLDLFYFYLFIALFLHLRIISCSKQRNI